jgi:hypothetical protein
MRSASASRSGRLRPSGRRGNHNRGSKIAHSQFVISPHARVDNWQGSSELTCPVTTSSAKHPSDHIARFAPYKIYYMSNGNTFSHNQ